MTDYSATPAELEIILSGGVGDYLTDQVHDATGTYLSFTNVKQAKSISVKRNETTIGASIGLFNILDANCYEYTKSAAEVNQIIREQFGLEE
jgi:hypothetical protein